ncbi:TetR family transcriptional regulator [Cohnella zeiphila]|uniref:TetR family transcriptional regulator n=1 Tax=Cohnella zeiphila TaxID=2761120 RepID=A0A7X0SM99_9BACL|nr:TetR family transcriptional regulator [Cohnella zeiphila]MBB6732499.1 TetR family transcriptional regulator [Cohnella zeiphila]
MPPDTQGKEKIGLRERKKRKTRLTLQQQALRLFREQGYRETTIEQIAEACEISPSTFFRYFPTKEALVLDDEYDPILVREFQRQPPELTPIQAFRAAARAGFAGMTLEESAALKERIGLMISVPELRAASLMQMNETLLMIAEIMAERLGRSKDDFQVMTFAGSILGAMMTVQIYCKNHPEADFAQTVDEALSYLETGQPLAGQGTTPQK